MSKIKTKTTITNNPWQSLSSFTDARIALGRAGTSLPTHALLDFQLSHAQAIDAVKAELDSEGIHKDLNALRYGGLALNIIEVGSQAGHRQQYLQRPDLGRRLSESDTYTLQQHRQEQGYDLAVVIADGLSASAVNQHAVAFVSALLRELSEADCKWTIAPVCLAKQSRVALGDDIAHALQASMVLMIIGERPGLSSPDSVGLYFTWQPLPGCDDAKRNCISNVRPKGLDIKSAAKRCHYLMQEAYTKRLSGVALKDRSDDALLTASTQSDIFLLTNND